MCVEHGQVPGCPAYGGCYIVPIPLFRRRADKTDERRPEVGPERSHLPIHPPVRVCSFCEVLRAQRAPPVLGSEVPHDDVGLPEHEAAVRDRRHKTVRIQPQVLSFLVAAETTANINALIAKVQLSATPQNLLDVYGVTSTPDPKHSPSERLVGQPRDQAWEESENEYPDREDGHVGERAREYVAHRDVGRDALHHVQVQAYRRCDQAHLHVQSHHHAEPYRVEPELRNDWEQDWHGDEYDRYGWYEAP